MRYSAYAERTSTREELWIGGRGGSVTLSTYILKGTCTCEKVIIHHVLMTRTCIFIGSNVKFTYPVGIPV